MYNLVFYEDLRGVSELKTFILALNERAKTDKDARILKNKVFAYLNQLEERGTRLGLPAVRYLEEGLWELRPLEIRIMFSVLNDGEILLLHHFIKKTQKTPRREIKKAERELTDYLKRRGEQK